MEKNVYIYLNGGNWQVGVKLPLIYAGIDLKGATKVELELNTDTLATSLETVGQYQQDLAEKIFWYQPTRAILN